MRILVVEDDSDLAELVALGLRNLGAAVDVARTASAAEEMVRALTYDIACLDLGLPDGDGLDLLRRMAVEPAMLRPRRVLILTARDAIADRVAGLDAGADDYLVKPFDFAELTARVRALDRRSGETAATVTVGDIDVDTAALTAKRGGLALELTPREFSLLRYFVHHPGRVIAAEELLDHVWDGDADPFTTSVRVILSRLRRKLGDPPVIVTLPGVGYRLEVER